VIGSAAEFLSTHFCGRDIIRPLPVSPPNFSASNFPPSNFSPSTSLRFHAWIRACSTRRLAFPSPSNFPF